MDKSVPAARRFIDRVAIVTGGSSGIGKAIVEELCKEGASVVFTGISDTGSGVEKELKEKGLAVSFLRGDMADESFCKKVVENTIKSHGTINYLVNNAFSFVGKGVDATTEDWERIYFAGPVAYARMVQGCIPPMRENGGGSIVNMSSISAHIAQPERWTYNSAKGAVNQMTRCQAMDLGKYGIRVNSVSPAYIWTRELYKEANNAGGGREKWEPVWGQLHMLLRCGEAVEVARPVLFLLSDDASFISGADLPIDAGYLAMGPDGLGADTSRWSKE